MSSISCTASDRMMEISTSSRATAAPPPGSGSKVPGMEAIATSGPAGGVWSCPARSLPVVLEGGPQSVAVHGLDVALHLLARTAGDDRLAIVVRVQHELGGLVLGVAEVRLKDVRHIAHEVDRVVVGDGDPRDVGFGYGEDLLRRLGAFDLHGCG